MLPQLSRHQAQPRPPSPVADLLTWLVRRSGPEMARNLRPRRPHQWNPRLRQVVQVALPRHHRCAVKLLNPLPRPNLLQKPSLHLRHRPPNRRHPKSFPQRPSQQILSRHPREVR